MPDLSSIVYVGGSLAQLREDVPHTIEIDETGVASAQLTYNCQFDLAVVLVKQLQRHPDYAWLVRKKATIDREEGYIAKVVVTFEGIDPTPPPDAPTNENGEIVTYAVQASTDAEPIETHPSFYSFAGKPNDKTTWINGAYFDPEGQFKGFRAPNATGQNKKAGIRSYLSPGLVYIVTTTRSQANHSVVGIALAGLGHIDTPPNSIVMPTVEAGRNWLKIGADVETIGDGIRITERWKLSGRGGWDTDLYS